MSSELLRRLKVWAEEGRLRLSDEGISTEITESDEHLLKKSIAVYIGSSGRGALVTVWDSGEVNISTADYASEAEPAETYELVSTEEELVEIANRLRSWVKA